MKTITSYITEKLIIGKRNLYDPENELGISPAQLQYIDTLIRVAIHKDISAEQFKTVYTCFTNGSTKGLEDLKDNIFRYLNHHPLLEKLPDNEVNTIYNVLKEMPEDELIKYRNITRETK